MEEENQVLGKSPEALESIENLESEDFIFYNQNKEEARNNIDSSAKDLTDFIEGLIKDVPAPSEEEIEKGKKKILEKIYSDPVRNEKKTDTKKKVTLKVLFLAAVLSALSVSGLFALGNSRNISIENGFMAFAKDTIQIVFFSEDENEYISVDALLLDLEKHGYNNILFPEEFIIKSDEYKASVPKYSGDDLKQVSFDVFNNISHYTFIINNHKTQREDMYKDLKDAKTVSSFGINMYVYEYINSSAIEFTSDRHTYRIVSDIPYAEIFNFTKTIKMVEDIN